VSMEIHKFTVNTEDTILRTMHAINEGGIGVAVIEDKDKKYFGLVTDGDVRRALLDGVDLHEPVKSIARKDAVTASEKTSYESIFSLMNEKIRHIPIIDAKGRAKDLVYFSYRKEIPVAKPFLRGNELKYVTECILGNWISSQGNYVNELERRFSEFCGVDYSLAVSNGTVALHLALVCLGIKRGDEVIVPSLTFIATANAVTYTGAKPVFVDSECDTYNIDPRKIEKAVTRRTKAIIPVHLYGQPAKMDEIMAIARKHKIHVVEDAAEAHGAEYKQKKVGSIGDIGCFSFFGNKIITTGEGGMVVTNNHKIYQKARILRDHGMSLEKKYWHEQVGFNYRMTNVQAAIGCAQMEKVEVILKEKQKIARMYKKYLSPDSRLILPQEFDWSKNVYWMYPVTFKTTGKNKENVRNKIIEFLAQDSIGARPFFYPIHTMPPYYSKSRLPVAESVSENGIVLPAYMGMQEKEIQRICNLIKTTLDKILS